MQEQVDQIREDYKIKTEGIIQNMQQAIDESFNRIDAQLDQILNDRFNFIQISPSQLQSDLPKINTLLQFSNYDYQKQINQEVTSLIKTNIQKSILKEGSILSKLIKRKSNQMGKQNLRKRLSDIIIYKQINYSIIINIYLIQSQTIHLLINITKLYQIK